MVTKVLSAVVRSILEACRTLGVWLVSLVFWYVGSKSIGEKWSEWSYLELFGFILLLAGTFAYKALIKLPCVSDEVYAMAERADAEFADEQKRRAEAECQAQIGAGGGGGSTDKYHFLPAQE